VAERPLAGRRIAVTRPDSRALVEALERLGAEVAVVPLIEIRPAESLRVDISSYDWIVLTSVNGVRAVADGLHGLGGRTHVAAVGPATAAAVRALGVEPAVVGTGATEALPDALGELAGKRALLPQADIASPELASALRARGAVVDGVVAYRTVPVEATREGREALGRADAVLLASGSAARSLVAQGGAGGALVVCIGPKTAAAAREVGLEVGLIAPETTSEGMIEALVTHFSEDE